MPDIDRIHIPVLADRIVELLAPALAAPGSVFVDCTLGLAGHASLLLDAAPTSRLVGIDRDADALALAGERLARFGDRVTLVQAVYDELPEVLADLRLKSVAAILADLGLSSLQIDRRDRGFAYAVDAPLDMRMDTTSGQTAADIVNTYSVADLTRILRTFGEERFADRIARRIADERIHRPFDTSARLVQVLDAAIPTASKISGGHPAKRTFQALRIEVNHELEALEGLLPAALAALAPNGRLAVLAYHSLEDRLVKNAFRDASTDTAPRGLPMVLAEHRAQFALLTKGAERPAEVEQAANPRAASARLRAIRRLEAAA
ncbi:16S rRNA (cytosine(1402)-N(4))-methyltransferase RsmH [Propioniciclava tarda]|uniref:Ribosomal RNA small subunit methyltransferase H n=1 Tax=Propioniciclava tarda TaxID=433330 RepID=A0A4Q9KLF2_PROTD|nr:16S rRNA (cytosine(1402)-N(4))-methyltransferase RsmH [Propioniciclava tarda]TBT94750.1 16S rRNA (cytosine(1402)-N(4))-methyltransferase RsmH [Propioniciclava tarda]SMO64593.1 16S rRNA (cytosine1402-N4)-methyltransferase [Propioniciclava tarda]